MTKFVLDNPNLHHLFRTLVFLVVAPYLVYAGYIYKDDYLLLLGIALFIADVYLMKCATKDSQMHQIGRLVAILVQAPYMWYASTKYNDGFLKILVIGTLLADSITFWEGLS